MTIALKNIFVQLSKMPPKVQNTMAELIKDEMQWDESFSKTQRQLSILANEALDEYKKGLTRPLKLK